MLVNEFIKRLCVYRPHLVVLLIPMVTSACNSGPFEVPETADRIEINSAQGASDNPTEDSLKAPLEKIDVVLMGSSAQLRVLSNGCTSAEHFSITQEATDECKFIVTRSQPDFCKRATSAVSLTIQWQTPAGCSLDEVVFSNPPLAEK